MCGASLCISRNLENDDVMARVGSQRHKKYNMIEDNIIRVFGDTARVSNRYGTEERQESQCTCKVT